MINSSSSLAIKSLDSFDHDTDNVSVDEGEINLHMQQMVRDEQLYNDFKHQEAQKDRKAAQI